MRYQRKNIVFHVTSDVKKITMNIVVVLATDSIAEHRMKKVTNPSITRVITKEVSLIS